MVEINIEILGEKVLARAFSKVEKEVKDFREPFRDIAADFYKVEREIFDAEGKPQKFKPLNSEYYRWKMKRYPGKKIMQLTGRLMNSLTAKNQATAQDTIKKIRKKDMELGTRAPYANYHQKHGRKIVQVTEQTQNRWSNILHKWMMGVVDKGLK